MNASEVRQIAQNVIKKQNEEQDKKYERQREARRKWEEARPERMKKCLEYLFPLIKEQAEKGNFAYKYSHTEGEFIAKELVALGFTVTIGDREWHGAILNYEMGTEYGPESGKGHYETPITIKW